MFKNAYLALYNRDQIQDIKIHLQSLLHSQIIVTFKIFAILIANNLMIKFIISTIQFTNLLSSIYQQRSSCNFIQQNVQTWWEEIMFQINTCISRNQWNNFMKTDHEYYTW